MKIISFPENKNIEKRVAITPEIAKKYISVGFSVSLLSDYGSHLGFNDEEYKSQGVEIQNNEKDLIQNSNVIVQLGLPSEERLSLLKENQNLVGILNPFLNKDKLNNLAKRKVNNFSLELLPRITRAQSMDILSSQANLAGYKAVIDSFAYFQKAIPMMMTAAGTISAAKVLMKKISALWKKECFGQNSVELKITGLKYGELQRFRNLIKSTFRGIFSINERRVLKGKALWELKIAGSISTLAAELSDASFEGKTVEILDKTNSSLVISLKK